NAGKGDALAHGVAFGALKSPQKIEVPPRAAGLAVGGRFEAGRLLLFDDGRDFAVLRLGERGRAAPPARVSGGGLLAARRAQQVPDVVGAERRTGWLVGHLWLRVDRLLVRSLSATKLSCRHVCNPAAWRGQADIPQMASDGGCTIV